MKKSIIHFLVYLLMPVIAGNACAKVTLNGVTKTVNQGKQTVSGVQSFVSHPTISGAQNTLSDVGSFAIMTAGML